LCLLPTSNNHALIQIIRAAAAQDQSDGALGGRIPFQRQWLSRRGRDALRRDVERIGVLRESQKGRAEKRKNGRESHVYVIKDCDENDADVDERMHATEEKQRKQ
jgi:hypothetical protein